MGAMRLLECENENNNLTDPVQRSDDPYSVTSIIVILIWEFQSDVGLYGRRTKIADAL